MAHSQLHRSLKDADEDRRRATALGTELEQVCACVRACAFACVRVCRRTTALGTELERVCVRVSVCVGAPRRWERSSSMCVCVLCVCVYVEFVLRMCVCVRADCTLLLCMSHVAFAHESCPVYESVMSHM